MDALNFAITLLDELIRKLLGIFFDYRRATRRYEQAEEVDDEEVVI